jgi:arylsulfatase A-like enzyme
MPAVARWPGKIAPATETMALVSTLDVVPTVLSILGKQDDVVLDGIDISSVLFGKETSDFDDRVLFFWRDGFEEGPLGPPYGRFEVVAIKVGSIKAWIWTKSAHYNADEHVFHDPPLLFDVIDDPAEAFPLDPTDHAELVARIPEWIREHKESVDWTFPLALFRDPKYIPCINEATGCRTTESHEMEVDVE